MKKYQAIAQEWDDYVVIIESWKLYEKTIFKKMKILKECLDKGEMPPDDTYDIGEEFGVSIHFGKVNTRIDNMANVSATIDFLMWYLEIIKDNFNEYQKIGIKEGWIEE